MHCFWLKSGSKDMCAAVSFPSKAAAALYPRLHLLPHLTSYALKKVQLRFYDWRSLLNLIWLLQNVALFWIFFLPKTCNNNNNSDGDGEQEAANADTGKKGLRLQTFSLRSSVRWATSFC